MKTADAVIAERLPVWGALSELFLDTEIEEADLDRLAAVLAASAYAEEKLEEILRFEVTPVLKANLQCMAGEWAGFDPAWLREKLAPRIDTRPFLRWPVSWWVRTPWRRIKSKVSDQRKSAPSGGRPDAK